MGSTGNVIPLEYLKQANDSLLTIVQIETKEAVDNVRCHDVATLITCPCSLLISKYLTEMMLTETHGRLRKSPKFRALTCYLWDYGISETTSDALLKALFTMT